MKVVEHYLRVPESLWVEPRLALDKEGRVEYKKGFLAGMWMVGSCVRMRCTLMNACRGDGNEIRYCAGRSQSLGTDRKSI
jgi:hypothetical protein